MKESKEVKVFELGGGCAVDVWVTERWWEWTRVQIRSYVGGGMHGQAGPASQCCIIAYSDRREVDLKWRTCAHCLNTLSSCHRAARLSSPNKKNFSRLFLFLSTPFYTTYSQIRQHILGFFSQGCAAMLMYVQKTLQLILWFSYFCCHFVQ